METATAYTVIHKKARVAREEFDARAMSLAKALRLGLAKAADVEMDLALSVTTLEQTMVARADLSAACGDSGLLLLVEGEAGRRGAVRIDFAALTSVIEQLTIGHVTEKQVTERALTRTDAALIAPLIDATFKEFDARLAELPEAESWVGYRFGAMLEDVHALELSLDAETFQHFRVSVSLANGRRAGVLDFVIPNCAAVRTDAEGSPSDTALAEALGAIVMEAPVALQAVLGRVIMPLEQALGLTVGESVQVQVGTALSLRLEGTRGHLVSEARLGQLDGARAVRLLSDVRGPEDTMSKRDAPAQDDGMQALTNAMTTPDRPGKEVKGNPAATTDIGSAPEHAADKSKHESASQIEAQDAQQPDQAPLPTDP